jgi:hypothetical protein
MSEYKSRATKNDPSRTCCLVDIDDNDDNITEDAYVVRLANHDCVSLQSNLACSFCITLSLDSFRIPG